MIEFVEMCIACKTNEATKRTFAGPLCGECDTKRVHTSMIFDLRQELFYKLGNDKSVFDLTNDQVLAKAASLGLANIR